ADWFAQQAGEDAQLEASSMAELRAMQQGIAFPGIEFYLPWVVNGAYSLLDYLPPNVMVYLDDGQDLADTVTDLEEQALGLRQAHEASGNIPPDMAPPYLTWGELQDALDSMPIVELDAAADEGSF